MSTFDGNVKEIPYIRIDNFCNYVESTQIFFISHCHSDHMKGICDEFFYMLREKNLYLYASPISARILKNRYPGCDNQLKILCIGESTLIETVYSEETVYLNVFVIPAGHCPGSVMFLFKTNSKTVLYTGDFRIDKKEQFFKKYFKAFKKIDNIYLDTTFCKKQYPHFPARKETAQCVCHIIKNWLDINEKNIIQILVPTKCGSEYIIREIFKKTRQKILVSKDMYDLHKFIPEMDDIVKCNDTSGKIRIHVKCSSSYGSNFVSENVCTINMTAMIWEGYRIGDSIIQSVGINNFRVCASYHPSYTEICKFIEYLKPVEVEPCVLPDDEEGKKEMIKLLDGIKGLYKNKIKQNEIYEIKPSSLSKQGSLHNQKHLENQILSSPPRKFSRKRKSVTKM